MRKTDLRGGNDYKINEILGKNFKDFVSLLRGNDLSKFTFEAYGDKSASINGGPNTPKPNDLHYDFTQYLMATTIAFREIESPDVEKAAITEEYANDFYKMYDELINAESGTRTTGGLISPEKYSFYYKELPYYEGKGINIKYLSSVLHFLPYTDKVFENYNDTPAGALVNAIRYLYHFISLLDLDNINVKDIMVLLRTDNAVFIPLVDDIVDTVSNSVYFTKASNLPSGDEASKAVIREGVINGLTIIAEEIINELRAVPTNPGILPVKYEDIRTLNFTNGKDVAEYFGKLINSTNAPTINNITNNLYGSVGGYYNLYDAAPNASKAVPDEAQRKAYAFNSLMNPYYLSKDFAEEIDAKKITGELVQMGGFKKKPVAPGAGKTISLPFLYGPETPAGKRFLTTYPTQGNFNNANLMGLPAINRFNNYIDLVTDYGTNRENGIKVALLSIATYFIINNKRFNQMAGLGNDIAEHIRKNLQAYTKYITRIRSIPRNAEDIIKRYRESFVSEFVNRSYKDYYINPSTNKLEARLPAMARPTGESKKSNLTNPTIENFYTNVVAADPQFYSEFFNLVRLADTPAGKGYNGDVPLGEAKTLPKSELVNYRLNVKKNIGYSRLHNLQYGGADASSYGDIVLISLIADYPTNGSIGDDWVTKTEKISKVELTKRGTNAIRDIARITYVSKPAGTGIINVMGVDVNVIDIQRYAVSGFMYKRYPEFLKNYLRGLASESYIVPGTTWKEGELLISEHMLKEGNTWQRNGDHFVKYDKDGKEIDNVPLEDSCTFINDTRECLAFLTECLPSSSELDYNTFCVKLLDFEFATGVGMKVLKEEVQKIDPSVAFAILRKLRFGSYLEEEKYDPVKGFRRYKVQSVGSWLEELMTGLPKDRCKKYTAPVKSEFGCGPLKEQLGALADIIIKMAQDPKKHNFFNYLDILVHWVNANPQVLNPEETVGVVLKQNYPKISNSFRTYDYVDPYRPAEIRLRGLSCGLDRLKSNIMNELSGANVGATISTIANVPLGIEMPLSRYGFTNPIPFGGVTPMIGGHLYDIDAEFTKWNQAYGYELFDSIFRDLYSTMGNLVGKRGIKLTNNTNDHIKEKLEKFKETEEALRKSLKSFIERNKLFQASRGHINSFDLNDTQFATVLEKHSNLLSIGSAYNRRAVNLIDLFQTITKAILTKIDEGSTVKSDGKTDGSKYERPLTMDFHYHQFGKKN
jgi:hypothetical protein